MASANRGREREDVIRSRNGDSDRDRYDHESKRPDRPVSIESVGWNEAIANGCFNLAVRYKILDIQ